MTADEAELPRGDAPRFRRARRAGVGAALVLLVVLGGAWSQRRGIATGYVDDYLAARGVPARYRIADLGFGRQRLTDVVIGDPAHPDLVADWIELGTRIGFGTARVTAVRAGHVRVRARLVGGRLSLGSIDRLIPASSGGAFALPAIDLDVADARMRLETPQGPVALTLAGRGRLDGGFRGQLAAVAPRLVAGGCSASDMSVTGAVAIDRGAPSLKGPARVTLLACGAAEARGVSADIAAGFDARLVDWQGSARLAVAGVRSGRYRVDRLAGTISAKRNPFAGLPDGMRGTLDLRAGAFDIGELAGESASLTGDFVYGPSYNSGMGFVGYGPHPGMRLHLSGARLAPGRLAAVAGLSTLGAGTPVAPLAARLAQAVAGLGRRFDADADLQPEANRGESGITLYRLALRSASGARIDFTPEGSPEQGIDFYRAGGGWWRWRGARGWVSDGQQVDHSGVSLHGTLVTGGGGLPDARVTLAQIATNAPVDAVLAMRPYAAGDARLALTGTRLHWTPGQGVRLVARATLSGPLGDGRIEQAALPIDARWDGSRLRVDGGCTPIGWERLAVSGLVLGRAALTACPVGSALFAIDGGRVSGGARIAAPRLAGRLGDSPLALAASRLDLRLGEPGFAAASLTVRLGDPDRLTRLDFDRIDGAFVRGALTGRFAGGGGQIANVPLLLSGAAGGWRFAGGRLTADAALSVADAAADPRFRPLAAKHVTLTLAGNRIDASGVLDTPRGIRVADLTIAHDLGAGAGRADLRVPGLAFGESLQPEELTRLTYGVIAEVKGTVSGEGHIRWSDAGVTSDGRFRTDGTDLAAAFGPVTGLKGEIVFADLLGLTTAPGQAASVGSINPGVPVTDGVVRYQLLPDLRIAVEGARWPFAGGELVLDPTVLDFAEDRQRRMTFRVTGVDAARFLQQFDFKNLDATGTFDGVLPMVFDEAGGRIEGGHLTARPGGGTIAYVGEVSQENLGFWGNFAFQALKSLRYRDVGITMNGSLAGEMITEVRFAGIGQGEGAKSNFLIRRLAGLPLVFNVRIKAPFRQLIDSAQSFYDPRRLIERNLPALIRERDRRRPPVQPPASETVP